MLGNDATEFLKTLHKLDEIWKEHKDAEYNERQLVQFAERYHKHKLKLLGMADVSGRSEQLSDSPQDQVKRGELDPYSPHAKWIKH